MKTSHLLITVAMFFVFGSSFGLAHHSVPVNFDLNSNITVTGKLIKSTWVNPHSQMILEVTTAEGTQENWLVEMNAINTMIRKQFPTDEFIIGDVISVSGYQGKHDKSVYYRSAKLPNGKEIIWTSELDPSEQKLE